MKYEDLIVWQKSFEIVKIIYKETKKFPENEKFGIISQIRRAAVSIPSNIAEGHGRKSTKAYINHLSIAVGSLMELETLIKISNELKYLSKTNSETLLKTTNRIGKMLTSLIQALQKKCKE